MTGAGEQDLQWEPEWAGSVQPEEEKVKTSSLSATAWWEGAETALPRGTRWKGENQQAGTKEIFIR